MSTQPDPVLQAYLDVFGSTEELYYHYTTVESALHILNIPDSPSQYEKLTPSLRLTAIEDLKDPEEGRGISDEEIDKLCPNLKKLEQEAQSLFIDVPMPKKEFVFSLAKTASQPNLWRSYGQEGMGVCIGIRFPRSWALRISYPGNLEQNLRKLDRKLETIKFDPGVRIYDSAWGTDGLLTIGDLRTWIRLGYKTQIYANEEEHRVLRSCSPFASYIDTNRQHIDLPCTISNHGKNLSDESPTIFELTFGPRVTQRDQDKFTGFKVLMPDISFFAMNNKLEPQCVHHGELYWTISHLKRKRSGHSG